jgi:hypothetical protein
MSKILLSISLAASLTWAGSWIVQSAKAADLDLRASSADGVNMCHRAWRCSPQGCGWRRICGSPCPDGYSCFSLYGAYGPYGGAAYWSAYTSSGWTYAR